jgi:glycerophosphoryl diester phosphodiesterase
VSGEPGLTFGADHPIVVAHRGASAEQPENTIEAFEAAIDAGADAVEFDVRLTADGVPVVMHDPYVDRTTDGSGSVEKLPIGEIRELGIALPGGGATSVPTLEEALSCLTGRAAADVELKNDDYAPMGAPALEATLEVLDRVAFVGPVLFSSFDEATLRTCKQARPDVPTGLLTSVETDVSDALESAVQGGFPWVLPFVGQVLEAGSLFVDEVHDAGLLLGIWIADDEEMARALYSWGADAVATNDPRAIVPIRDELAI